MIIHLFESGLRSLRLFVLSAIFFAVTLPCASPAPAQQVAAVYAHGNLPVTVHYHSEHAGAGKLVTEILDPEDRMLGRTVSAVDAEQGDGVWEQTIVPAQRIPFDEIVWQRIRYRFEYDDAGQPAIEGIESISRILRRPVVRILGQKEYLAGSSAAIRIIVSDAGNHAPMTGSIRIEMLIPNQESHLLFSGSLNRRGTLKAAFRFPEGLTGRFDLRLTADTPIGSTETVQSVEVLEKASILLTSEKPIYQPGQTIHARALVLNRADHKAAANRKLTFEVEDSRGNKVFRRAAETDKFGIASAEFSLADEVNLGAYHLRALMGSTDTPANTAEIALNVERYVLPKFKVAVEFDQKNGKPQRDYRPGDHVTGTVRANYFFGKPVDHAEITIKASSMDVAVFEAASASGTTDSDGAYRFDLKLPSYFAGHPLSQGSARALIEATVKDSAVHAESRGEPITISESPLLITAIPEGGVLIPGIENEVFILASYPDGSPANATLTIHNPEDIGPIPLIGNLAEKDLRLSTNAAGVAVLRIKPMPGLDSLRIEADDHHGNRASSTVPLQTRAGTDQILLHTDQAVFKAGDRIQLKVFSTHAHGAAYVDVVKNGQTILTRDIDLDHGQAELTLNATPEMSGTLDIDAYLFGRDAQPVADHRLVFVQPANELKIETTADAAEYRPGSEARIRFHVTNARGEGVSAAIGLEAIDEAVFALAEKQPGFAKVFFYLEQELMKPRYEIHSLLADGIVEDSNGEQASERDIAARVLFSAAETVNPHTLDTEAGREMPQEKRAEYDRRYYAAFEQIVRELAEKINLQSPQHLTSKEIVKILQGLTMKDGLHPHDAWGTPLRFEATGLVQNGVRYILVQSAGPDHQFNGGDYRTGFYILVPERKSESQKGNRSFATLHQRGEMTGVVTDITGAVVAGARVTLRNAKTGDVRTATCDAKGNYDVDNLEPGSYELKATARGFQTYVESGIVVNGFRTYRVDVKLMIGSETQTVSVVADALAVQADSNVVSRLISSQEISNIAIKNRNFAALAPMSLGAGAPQADAPHIRSYFPEALYINPEILTDGNGNASISIPIADSITTWRMAMLASTQSGALGSGTSSLKVFQDFFVDLDLPVTLTQGDRVSIPIAIYNYSGKPGEVSLQLQPDDWYALDNDTPEKAVSVESGRVGGSQFTLSANRIGKFKLTLSARMEGSEGEKAREDVVVREIEVIPNGREQDIVFNGRLDSKARREVEFPAASILDATSVLVRLYPGPLSQIVEGMDSILQMPGGCFEQTSSSTYPNVLALDYMKRTKKLTPEIHAKAEGYIANGYQRLLTFEVPGGGFSWFGQAPANKILTAYGLMEFNDMSKVSDVDQRLIDRTGAWLASQQQPDGSWKPDTYFINEGATNRYNSDTLRITAYIAWSLANTGYQGPAIEKAKEFIDSHPAAKLDPYTLAVIANFAIDYAKDREFINRSMKALVDARSEQGDQVSWPAEETGVYSTGQSAAIETTGLATQALLKWGQASETARKALSYISSKKQAAGNWGTTQATIMALRALLLATQMSASDVHGNLEIVLNGKPVETLKLTGENNDLLHQFVFKGIDPVKPATVELDFDGAGSLAYQIVGRSFIPWEERPVEEPLSIDVAYDRTSLAQDDIVRATATVRNNLSKTAKMVMVDLGIPPGFELLSEDLESYREKSSGETAGRLEKFSLTATQAILYFNALSQKQTVTVTFRLRAKYPIRARTFSSKVFEYYDPEVNATAHPVQMEVTERK
jgi:uncharacterized protein YfaS (alpha-2-macroglobulin family)